MTPHQTKHQTKLTRSTLWKNVMPMAYGLAGFFLAVSISTNALQIQSSLLNAYQTIMGVFVTSDGQAVRPDESNLVMSFNEGGNGTLRFGNMTGNELTVLTLNPRGEILRKTLNELSGSIRDLLSGSFVSNDPSDVWDLISGEVLRQVGAGGSSIVVSGDQVIDIPKELEKRFSTEYIEFCKQNPELSLCTGGSNGGILNTGDLLDPALEEEALNQYFDINRTTSRPGVPAVNVGGGSTPSSGTTVKDFLEGYFFPDVAVPQVGVTTTPAGGEYATTTPATTTATVTVTIRRTKHPITSATLSVNNGGSASPSTIPASLYNALPVGGTATFVTTVTIPKNTSSSTVVTATAKDDKNRSASASQSYSWFQLMYFGLDPDTSLTDAEIRAFPTKPQKASTASNITYAGAAGYRYAVMPADLFAGGKNLEVRNTFGIENGWTCTTQTFVNAAGYSTSYRVCRSAYAQTPTQSFTYQFAVK